MSKKRGKDKILEGERVRFTSGVLPVHVGRPEGYELGGREAVVVADEEMRPGVDELGSPTGREEAHAVVRPILPDGRLGSVIDVPTRRLSRGRGIGFFFRELPRNIVPLPFLNPFARKEEPATVRDEATEDLVDSDMASPENG